MKRRLTGAAWIALSIFVAAAPAVRGQDPGAAAEPAGRQLADFLSAFEGLGGVDAEALARAREELAAAPAEQVDALEARLAEHPEWRALPRVLELLEVAEVERRERLRQHLLGVRGAGPNAAAMAAAFDAAELEVFRADFLYLVARMRAFAPIIEHPDYDLILARAAERIRDYPAERLGELQALYARRAPLWQARLRGEPPRLPGATGRFSFTDVDFDSCVPTIDIDCSFSDVDCWSDEIDASITSTASSISCFITAIADLVDQFFDGADEIFGTIPGMLDDVEGFFLGIWDTVESFLTALWDEILDALPTDMSSALAVLSALGEEGFADLAGLVGGSPEAEAFWSTYLETEEVAVFLLSLTCDDLTLSIGTEVTLFGEVGSARAEWVCKRGVDWFNEYIEGRIPEDKEAEVAFGIAYKTFFFFPLKYYCACFEHQSALSFAVAQTDHVTLVETLFDEDLATRADDAGMETLRTSLDELSDPGVSGVQQAIDDGARGGDDADAKVADLDVDVAAVEDLVDELSVSQSGQQELIEDFEALEVRLNVEENLILESPFDAMAVFQLPASFDGFLEEARDIVEQTIVMTQDAGLETAEAEKELAFGDALFSEGAYEKAYEAYRRAYREAVRVVDGGGGGDPVKPGPGTEPGKGDG